MIISAQGVPENCTQHTKFCSQNISATIDIWASKISQSTVLVRLTIIPDYAASPIECWKITNVPEGVSAGRQFQDF